MLQNIRSPSTYLEFMVYRVDRACSKESNPKKVVCTSEKQGRLGRESLLQREQPKKSEIHLKKNKVDRQTRAMLQNIRGPCTEKACIYLEFMVDRVDRACSKQSNPKNDGVYVRKTRQIGQIETAPKGATKNVNTCIKNKVDRQIRYMLQNIHGRQGRQSLLQREQPKKKLYTCQKNKVDRQIRDMLQNNRSPSTKMHVHILNSRQIGQIEPAPKRATQKVVCTSEKQVRQGRQSLLQREQPKKLIYMSKKKVDRQIRDMLQNIRSPGTEKACTYIECMVERACSKESNPRKWCALPKNKVDRVDRA